MFGKKKQAPQPQERGSRKGTALMNQMGFGGMDGMDDDDDDLEAELAAITGGEVKKPAAKRKAPLDMSVIDRMAAESMRDIKSDEELSDTEDPDLLAELEDLTTESPSPPKSTPSPEKSQSGSGQLSLLQERMSMYQQASANAKATGDASKQRRLDRGIKTLSDLCKQAQSGRPVDEEEIPPPVALGSSSKQSSPQHVPAPTEPVPSKRSAPDIQSHQPTLPSPPAPQAPAAKPRTHVQTTPQAPAGNSEEVNVLHTRRDQYRNAALLAKKNNDLATAAKYVKICKQFDSVIAAAGDGKPIDLSQMPPPPPEFGGPPAKEVTQAPTAPKAERAAQQAAPPETEDDAPPAPTQEEARELFKAPPPPSSTMEALQQRLQKYQSAEAEAKAAGEGSKARRMGRISKQYQDAIRTVKAGRPFDFSELPTPPGFAPIPVGNSAPAPAAAAAPSLQPPAKAQGQRAPSPQRAQTQPAPAPKAAPHPAPHPGHQSQVNRTASSRTSISSRAEQQERFLQDRYEEFKQAALKAKRNNEIELAKNYIRCMQGMKPMLQAAAAGLPVDLAQVPPSPIADVDDDDKFVVVSAEDCQVTGDRDEVFETLKQDLIRQIRTCATNSQHFTKLGDVASAAKFQKLEQNSRKDLEALKNAKLHGDPVPKFHYETRSFSIVKCNTDLGDNDLELGVVRAIQLPLPSGHAEKDLDTYIKYEFPYPSEDQQSDHTETIKGSIDPEYQETFKVKIDRKSRAFHRVVERKAIKLEVYYKRGFFKGDKMLGTVNIKMLGLDQHSTVHDSYDLMDGRKTVGGKLEVKIRIRDPFKNKEVETVKEKWLVIDQFLRTLKSGAASSAKVPLQRQKSVGGTACMEVLRFERQQLDKQISYLKDSLSVTQTQTLKHKSALLGEKIELQQKQLREGGVEAWKAYVEAVTDELPSFEMDARQLTKVGDMQKAQMMLTKKKLAEKELAAIKAKIPDI